MYLNKTEKHKQIQFWFAFDQTYLRWKTQAPNVLLFCIVIMARTKVKNDFGKAYYETTDNTVVFFRYLSKENQIGLNLQLGNLIRYLV